MSGFAGSERAGERRRRRLAVDSEGSEPALPNSSDKGDSLPRSIVGMGREATSLTERNCPILSVVSRQAWKHWAIVFAGTIFVFGILVVGQAWPDWAPGYGPGLTRLLKSTSSPLVRWIYTLVLFLTAQGACLVWWARSRSLQDFHGNYRIWGWAAATWLFFSFVVATNAHLAFSQTVLHHIHWKNPAAPMWCWLLPAIAWGLGIALRLEPELRNDRSGHFLFLTAGGWYLAVAGMLCQTAFWPNACSPELSILLLAVFQLAGHASLFLSTTLHARHVLYFSAEPPQKPAKRRSAAKVVELPPPSKAERRSLWPKWLSLSRRQGKAVAETSDDGEPKKGRKRAVTAKKRTAARKPTRLSQVANESSEAGDESSETDESQAGHIPGNDAGDESNSSADERDSSSGRRYRIDGSGDAGNDDSSEGDDSDELKGLSKRERRKLQQQMKEEERRNRR